MLDCLSLGFIPVGLSRFRCILLLLGVKSNIQTRGNDWELNLDTFLMSEPTFRFRLLDYFKEIRGILLLGILYKILVILVFLRAFRVSPNSGSSPIKFVIYGLSCAYLFLN
jgi:hypothetical protein